MPSALRNDASSIGSGAQELVGYDIDLSPADGTARVVLDIDARHLNRNGSLHGGIVAMMLDAASGFAASRTVPGDEIGSVVTVSFTTHYLAPGLPGRVVATGRVAGGGRTLLNCDAELTAVDGSVLARSSGVFKLIRNPK